MEFLTKRQIWERVEDFLEGMPNNSRILLISNIDTEFLHIGEPFKKTLSRYQTVLINELVSNTDKKNRSEMEIETEPIFKDTDKDTRQGIFSEHKEKDFSR